MTREEVCGLLKDYNRNRRRREHLRVEIKYCESVTSANFIEDMAYSPQVLDDSPKGNETSDPTARLAVAVMDNGNALQRQYAKELEAMQKEFYDLVRDCGYVEAWLLGLPEKERNVSTWHEIDGRTWAEVSKMYEAEYGSDYSWEGVRTIKKRAIRMIVETSKKPLISI